MLQEHQQTELMRACAEARSTSAALNDATARWHLQTPEPQGAIYALHLSNFQLWHLEDEARDTRRGDAAIAATKRSIDGVNQRRNDTVEMIDAALLQALGTMHLPDEEAPMHSETPGQILDRLSILSLKLYHSEHESLRADATEAHREQNRTRVLALQEQQNDLAACLAILWSDILARKRRFKQYRQLKMYNDPALNPILYSAPKSH